MGFVQMIFDAFNETGPFARPKPTGGLTRSGGRGGKRIPIGVATAPRMALLRSVDSGHVRKQFPSGIILLSAPKRGEVDVTSRFDELAAAGWAVRPLPPSGWTPESKRPLSIPCGVTGKGESALAAYKRGQAKKAAAKATRSRY